MTTATATEPILIDLDEKTSDAGKVAAGVLVVAAAGELLRRLRLAQPGQK